MINMFEKDGIHIITLQPQNEQEKDLLSTIQGMLEREKEVKPFSEMLVNKAEENIVNKTEDNKQNEVINASVNDKVEDEYEQLLFDFMK